MKNKIKARPEHGANILDPRLINQLKKYTGLEQKD